MKKSTLIHPTGKFSKIANDIDLDAIISYDLDPSLNADEYWHSWLLNNREDLNSKLIILDFSCSYTDCKRLISHIRLSKESSLSNIPIVWLSNTDANFININPSRITYSLDPNTVLFSKGIGEATLIRTLALKMASPKTFPVDDYSTWFKVSPLKGSHQISNEWGAAKLAEVANLSGLAQNLSTHASHADIYFKYANYIFSRKYSHDDVQFNFEESAKPIKALLIDDNYDKGWIPLLKEVFHRVNSQNNISAISEPECYSPDNSDILWDLIDDKLKTTSIDIVFLDLRLYPVESEEGFIHTSINQFSGAKLLVKIKEKYPYVSVIIFTASSRAWNLEGLISLGADGYFIKPSPEIVSTQKQLRSDLNNLILLTINLKTKTDTLRPFWIHIANVITNRCLLPEKQIDENTTIVGQRIQERIKMFYGLLKRNFEDSKFNEMFYYSDIKLAFMTLWSCLNDIQYACYDKTDIGWTSPTGNNKHNIHIELAYISSIGIPSSHPKSLQRIKDSTNKYESILIVDYNSSTSVYSLGVSYSRLEKKPYDRSIGEQIAFLLIALKSASITDSSNGYSNVGMMLNSFASLKNKRNNLYLTHGNEDNAVSFFTKTEQENNEITLTDCARLYEIVHLLTRGELVFIDL
jgi:CheY-like chemotaxis protein